jgi:protein tyrosine phosphatase (PTP) superfamily phosphohydrolase (DUF442 family)
MGSDEIYNYLKVNDALLTGGQPTAEQLRAAAAEGVVNVINLATYNPPHSLEDEAGLVRALGMNYFHIPVEWENPRESDFAAFEATLAGLPPGKTLLHCAANFRVTAFYSLYAQKHLGWSEAEAEKFRATIWAGSHYPVWEAFIARMRRKIAEGQAGSAGGKL